METGATFWIASAVKVIAIVLGLVNLGALLLWVERRQSAMIQDRMGPNRANLQIGGLNIRAAGLLHSAADGIKMLWKEDFTPPGADKFLYHLAPVISLVPPLCLFAVIPFGPSVYWANRAQVFGSEAWNTTTGFIPLQIAMPDSGILVVFALASSGVLGAALAGSSSDNKFSLMGGLRAASQMVSYEVTMGFSVVGAFMVYQTVRLEQMVQWQVDHAWGIFTQPLAFLLFFTAAVAETKRVPFDAPEGESEIVAGYFTEYQPMKMGMFALGELVEVMTSSALLTTIFLGGWQFPFLKLDGFHLEMFGVAKPILMSHLTVVVISAITFALKVAILALLQMQIRWTLPRFRYDQIMKLGWRILLPLSLGNILVTGIVLLFING
ncbi:MAG: NADH-quinone oxidoreductase subunit H [Deltaproteobacteria bacterium]|nr:NADH-quinone oxidoreductase subunit H [Deltaproteobacteria bacterium]